MSFFTAHVDATHFVSLNTRSFYSTGVGGFLTPDYYFLIQGFRDNEVNRRLLKKNNGSIKRVVMDLVNGEDV